MKCRDILYALFELMPEDAAEEWDNVGLLTGRPEKEVKKIYIALDATDDVIDDAVKSGADMLLTHHPMIFKPMKKITGDDFTGRRVMELIKHDISYAAFHTNYDVCFMAVIAAEKLGIKDWEGLSSVRTDEKGRLIGYGCVGTLPSSCTLSECAELVKDRFDIPDVRIFGDPASSVETAAILPGSGGFGIASAIEKNADVYITGDISHHQGLDAVLQGLSVIDAGHYGIEKIFTGHMEKWFNKNFPDIRTVTAEVKEPFITK